MTPIFAGTFDPMTLGHLSVIQRMVEMFGKGVVLIATNPNKTHMLTGEERHSLIRSSLREAGVRNVGVSATYGLVADWARDLFGKQCVLVRGVRDGKDLTYEMEIAAFNRKHGVETLFLPAHTDVSSTQIKEWLAKGEWKEIEMRVTNRVAYFLREKMEKK